MWRGRTRHGDVHKSCYSDRMGRALVQLSMRGLLFGGLVFGAIGCGETKYDVFMKGQEIEGDAERGPCKLTYAKGEHAAQLSRGQLTQCLDETEKAIVLYEKAKSMGYADLDFDKVYSRAKERKANLEQMIEMVAQMEKDAIDDTPLPGVARPR